jgi:hypothetical protein
MVIRCTNSIHSSSVFSVTGEQQRQSHGRIAISADGNFLYTLNSADGTIGAFAIQKDGTLKTWARPTASIQTLDLTESQPISEESLRSANYFWNSQVFLLWNQISLPEGLLCINEV